MLPGFLGVILPVVPGVPYMFVVALAFAFFTDFRLVQGSELSILGLFALASIIIDYAGGIMGAKIGGASKRSMIYGFASLIAGSIIFPPIGGIVAMMIAIFITELIDFRDHKQAFKASVATIIGSITAVGMNFVLAAIFVLSFLFFAL